MMHSELSFASWLYGYCGGQAIDGSSCGANNGNVRHQWIEPLGKVQSYGYDELNRLQAMVEKDTLDASPVCSSGGSVACAGWQADQWGNQAEPEVRTFDRSSFTPTSLTQFNVKNQITLQSAVHDAAGRLSSMGDYQFRWDAEDRLRAVAKTGVSTMTGYEYDGEGRRVKKLVCGYAASGWCATGVTVTSVTVYDGLGRMAAEYGGTPAVGGVQYLGVDHLGSTRVVTNGAGALAARRDFLPYGELIQAGKNGRTTAMGYEAGEGGQPLGRMFTGKERDGETMSSAMPSGLDYFGARYFSGAQGRFTSPDPKEFTTRTIENPQKWNKYAYVRNNPLVMIDPDGQDDFYFFRPTANNTSASWRALQAAAPKYGHTVTIYNGTAATRDRYLAVAGTEGAHVVFTGHTVEDNTQRATAVLLGDNLGVGDPSAVATTLGFDGQPGGPIVAVGDVQATDVAVFGCNSTDLARQYSTTTFTGTRPTTNTVAQDAGAQAYTNALVRGGTVSQAAGTAQGTMQRTTNQANANPTKPMTYTKPQVCTTENGKTTCR